MLAVPALAAPKVMLNGNQLTFDVDPTIENGRTLVPLRAIFEALGADVSWDGATQTIAATKSNTQVVLQIGSQTVYKNDSYVNIDVPAKIINDRTMIPLRFISESFGAEVAWNSTTQVAEITLNDEEQPAQQSDPPQQPETQEDYIKSSTLKGIELYKSGNQTNSALTKTLTDNYKYFLLNNTEIAAKLYWNTIDKKNNIVYVGIFLDGNSFYSWVTGGYEKNSTFPSGSLKVKNYTAEGYCSEIIDTVKALYPDSKVFGWVQLYEENSQPTNEYAVDATYQKLPNNKWLTEFVFNYFGEDGYGKLIISGEAVG